MRFYRKIRWRISEGLITLLTRWSGFSLQYFRYWFDLITVNFSLFQTIQCVVATVFFATVGLNLLSIAASRELKLLAIGTRMQLC